MTYRTPELDTEFDGVALLDFLTDSERIDWGIVGALEKILTRASVSSFQLLCGNRLGALGAFHEVRSRAEAGKAYCIHIVAHGNEQGLGVGKDDFLDWRDLGAALVPVNRALKGRLIVNLTACKGVHALKAVVLDPGNDDPFFGILGVKHDLSIAEALSLNEKIYLLWLTGSPINEIVHQVNDDHGRDILHCASSEGFRALKAKP